MAYTKRKNRFGRSKVHETELGQEESNCRGRSPPTKGGKSLSGGDEVLTGARPRLQGRPLKFKPGWQRLGPRHEMGERRKSTRKKKYKHPHRD